MSATNLLLDKQHLMSLLIAFSISLVSLNAHATDTSSSRASDTQYAAGEQLAEKDTQSYDAREQTVHTYEQQESPTGSFLDRIFQLFKKRTIDSSKQVKQIRSMQTSLTVCPAAKAAMGFFADWLYQFGLTQNIEATMNSLFARSNLLALNVIDYKGFNTWTPETTFDERCEDLEEIFGPGGSGANAIAESIDRPMTTDEMGQWITTLVMGEEWFKCDHMVGYPKNCMFQEDGILKKNSPTTLAELAEFGKGKQVSDGAPSAPSGSACFENGNPFGFCSGSDLEEPEGGEEYMGTGVTTTLSNLFNKEKSASGDGKTGTRDLGDEGGGKPGGNFSCAVAICPWMYTMDGKLIDGALPSSTVLCPFDEIKAGGGQGKKDPLLGKLTKNPVDGTMNWSGLYENELYTGKGYGAGEGEAQYVGADGKVHYEHMKYDSETGTYYPEKYGKVNDDDRNNKVDVKPELDVAAQKRANAKEAAEKAAKEAAEKAAKEASEKTTNGKGGKAGYDLEGIDGGACGHMLRAMNESIAIICALEYPEGDDLLGIGTQQDEGESIGLEKAGCDTAVIMPEPGTPTCCKADGNPAGMWTNVIPHVTDPSPIRGRGFDPMRKRSPEILMQPSEHFKPAMERGPSDTRTPGTDPTR